jgi:hypothetical protein
MAKRIIKSKIVKAYSKKRAEEILKLIRSRNPIKIFKEYPTEPARASPSSDDWQKFKRDFVEEYGGETVRETGMTHSEFLDYFKNGTRECNPKGALRKFLDELYDRRRISDPKSTNSLYNTVTKI